MFAVWTPGPSGQSAFLSPPFPTRDGRRTAHDTEMMILETRLLKAPTGIRGLDETTGGGLPQGRPTLVCGSAGCGKTLLAMEFLVRGATEYGEPGVFFAFEENATDLIQNVASLGFDLPTLIEQRQLALDHIHVDRSEIEEAGEYDLEGLFLRIGFAIDSIGARRVVLDTIETLFAGFTNEGILRAELRRLFRWLKDRGVTAIITAERGGATLTRHGLEEYISDCVILLDHRTQNQIATRRMRIVKYRGSAHGTDELPFLIGEHGITVMPVTSVGLDHAVTTERISTGIPRLDAMLGGQGLYRGSSVLVSGTAGAGKSSIAAHAVEASCRRGERSLYFAFEESPDQIQRNMRSIGIDLEPWRRQGLLRFHAVRPTNYGLEMHLATMHGLIEQFQPRLVIVDPVSNFLQAGTDAEAKAMLMRLIDILKGRQITALFTSLTGGGDALEQTEVGVSSLMDTWLLLRTLEGSGERNRGLYLLKSRGMAHSNQVREFLLTDHGVELTDVYVGPAGVLTGAARRAQEAKEQADALARQEAIRRRQRDLERRRQALETQIASLRADFEAEEEEMRRVICRDERQEERLGEDRAAMARLRHADPAPAGDDPVEPPGKGATG
jgi:circadian clock protein KaiC